jgi:adenine-specific DNA-methyltransferase
MKKGQRPMQELSGTSKDIVSENIEKLKELFPEVFSEGKIDFKKLEEELGNFTCNEPERYNFTWAGKSEAKKIAQTPSTGTLRPCKEESKNWDITQNLYIEGDNLEVLKLLQKSYYKQVKMIYIDPPYNTGKDFVYKDNFHDNIKNYLEITGQVDGDGNKLSTNSDTNGRYHSDWLSMMYPRLKLARNLLKDDGVIFISIHDKEMHNLRKLLDEIFGGDNFLATLIWDKNHSAQAGIFKAYHEYIYVYAKNIEKIETPKSLNNEIFEAGAMKKESARHPMSEFKFPAGVRFDAKDGTEFIDSWGEGEKVELIEGRMICENGLTKYPVTLRAAYTQKNQMEQYFYGDRESLIDSRGQKVVEFFFNSSGKIKIVKERGVETPQTTLKSYGSQGAISTALANLFNLEGTPIDNPKSPLMLQDFVGWFTNMNEDIILDFFSGSATTAHAVMQLNAEDKGNCKFIMVQLPEITDETSEAYKAGYKNICEIGKERIRRAGEKIITENSDKDLSNLDIGFKVLKLDSSNIKAWDSNFENVRASLLDAVENIKEDRSSEDLLYEILLKYGLDLTLPIEEKVIDGKKVFVIGYGALVACLDDDITIPTVEAIAKLKDHYQSEIMRVVFKDASFKDAVVKTNAYQILKQFGIDEVVSV